MLCVIAFVYYNFCKSIIILDEDILKSIKQDKTFFHDEAVCKVVWIWKMSLPGAQKKIKEKNNEDLSYSVTLLIEHPAASEQFLHLMTNESEFASAFAQLGAMVLSTEILWGRCWGGGSLYCNVSKLNWADRKMSMSCICQSNINTLHTHHQK